MAKVLSNDSQVSVIGFAGKGTKHPDAFVIINLAEDTRQLPIRVLGTGATAFDAYRTSSDEHHVPLGELAVQDGVVSYDAPSLSVTTFYAV